MKKNIVNLAALSSPKVKAINVPTVGTVCIKQMNAKTLLEMNEKQQDLQKGKTELSANDNIQIGLILLAGSLCDEEGNLSYSDETRDRILELPMAVLQALLEKLLPEIMKFNGLGNPDALKELESKLPNAQKDSGTES